ncbi:MAG: hypothetical protein R3D90_15015 [Paracoccaceae bacterium]
MDHDLLLILGLGLAILSIPSLLSALIDDRLPIVAGFGLAVGGALVVWGVLGGDTGLHPRALAHLFFEVLGRYLP